MVWLNNDSQFNMFPIAGQASGNVSFGMVDPGAAPLARDPIDEND